MFLNFLNLSIFRIIVIIYILVMIKIIFHFRKSKKMKILCKIYLLINILSIFSGISFVMNTSQHNTLTFYKQVIFIIFMILMVVFGVACHTKIKKFKFNEYIGGGNINKNKNIKKDTCTYSFFSPLFGTLCKNPNNICVKYNGPFKGLSFSIRNFEIFSKGKCVPKQIMENPKWGNSY